MPRGAGQAAVQALAHGVRVVVAPGTGKLGGKPGACGIERAGICHGIETLNPASLYVLCASLSHCWSPQPFMGKAVLGCCLICEAVKQQPHLQLKIFCGSLFVRFWFFLCLFFFFL